ncbi:ABC transporter permease subunit [Chromobacterium haemolyticum]|uniref:ABC transporter permease subunit n=1 Tax=Chromobacterium fluminis TaxID=3044269 RepID=A0ABX0KZM2_9NEIS|nr:ABC transporter permease subunit [Chromobacterium haemolyticum]NHR04969.1 ABC transporter permease subunit [Chromobacterium haemolyticum]
MTLDEILRALPGYLWGDGGQWSGLAVTAKLFLISGGLGMLLAVLLALLRVYGPAPLRWSVAAFSYFFRGTPLFMQLMLIYYGVSQFSWVIDGWQAEDPFWLLFRDATFCAVLAYVLNTAAYAQEILAGALAAYPREEIMAAEAFGMSRARVIRRIVLPGALRRSIPVLSNEMVFLLHATALSSTVTLLDVTGVARALYAATYAPFFPFLMAAAIYLGCTFALLASFRQAERRWLKFLRPRSA